MDKKLYCFDWSENLDKFLTERGIKFTVSEADIIGIRIEAYRDTEFMNLILDFSCWLIINANKN